MNKKSIRVFIIFLMLCGGYFQLWAQNSKEEEGYSLAYGLYEQGLYDIALGRLQVFKNSFPESKMMDDVEFLMGECKFGQSNFKEALLHYERVRSKKYQDISILRGGQCYFYQSNYDSATLNFQRVITDFPKGRYADLALYFLAETNYKKGDYQRAIDIYNVIIKEYPDSQYLDQIYYSLGYCYYRKEEFDTAIQNLQKVITQCEPYQSSLIRESKILLGQSLQSIKDYNKAIKVYTEVLSEYRPGETGKDLILYEMGNAYFNLNDYTNAETYFSAVISEYPESEFTLLSVKVLASCKYRRNDFPGALESYKKILEKYPNSGIVPEAKYWIASVLNKLDKNEEALDAYKKFIEEYRGKWIADELVLESWLQIGEIYYQRKEFLQARNAFSEVIQVPLKFAQLRGNAILRIGDCLASEKNYKEAVELYKKVAKESDDESIVLQAKFQIAYFIYKQDDFTQAIPLFQEVINKGKSPIQADALYWLGWCYFKIGKFSDAEKVFNRLVTEDSSSRWRTDALYRLGDSLYNQGKYKEARSFYELVLSMGILQPESIFAIASSYYMEGKREEAIKTFRELIDKHPGDNLSVEASFKIAEFYVQKGDLSEAIKSYKSIVENFPDSKLIVQALIGIADSFFKSGKYKEAIENYQNIINKYPEEKHYRMESEFKIGSCYFQTGEIKKAGSIYQSFIEKYPESSFLPEVCYRLGMIYFNDNKYQESLPYLRKSISLLSKRSDLGAQSQCRIGDCLFNLGNYEEAVSEYLKVIVLYSNVVELHPEAQYKIGMSLSMKGRKDESRNSFQRVIEKYPGTKWAGMAKEQLAKIQ